MLLLGRKADKKRLSWFPNLLFLKTVLSRLDVGPAYYEDSVSSNPTYTKGIKAPLLGWSYEAYLIIILKRESFSFQPVRRSALPFSLYCRGSRGSYAAAFPGPFLLVLRPEAIASS